MKNGFRFNISLQVLNHLGRNLYRNFITVLGEAISNSWDADASNVWVEIDKDNNTMSICDDGIGMSEKDLLTPLINLRPCFKSGVPLSYLINLMMVFVIA